MTKFKLIRPTIEYKEQVLGVVQEFYDNNSNIYWVSWLKRYIDNYEWRLDSLKKRENKETIDDGHVPWKQFLFIRESDNKLIWFINARLELNEQLLVSWWHIWYCISPSERKHGYATAQLFAVLPIYQDMWVKKVLVTCDKTNIWSAKTIQKCGWIFQDEVVDPEDWEVLQRYRIDVQEWIEKWKTFFENNLISVSVEK